MELSLNELSNERSSRLSLTIYHDIGLKLDKASNRIVKITSPGHFYLGFTNGDQIISYGFNPINILNAAIGIGKVKNEAKRLKKVRRYKEESGEDVLYKKLLPLTHDQYQSALKYLEQNWSMNSVSTYIVGIRDCTYFVQDIYHSTGMSLYFTKLFTKNELLGLDTAVARNVLYNYGSRDTLQSKLLRIEAIDRKALANELNISEKQIIDVSWQEKLIIFCHDTSLSKSLFSVILNEEDLQIQSEDEVSPDHYRETNNAEEIVELLSAFSLTDKQAIEAQQDATQFFNNLQRNSNSSYMTSLISRTDRMISRFENINPNSISANETISNEVIRIQNISKEEELEQILDSALDDLDFTELVKQAASNPSVQNISEARSFASQLFSDTLSPNTTSNTKEQQQHQQFDNQSWLENIVRPADDIFNNIQAMSLPMFAYDFNNQNHSQEIITPLNTNSTFQASDELIMQQSEIIKQIFSRAIFEQNDDHTL